MVTSRSAKDDLRALVRDTGIRVTGPRIAVLTVLRNSTEPLTHGEVAERLAHDGLDRATVFRNLRDLSAVQLVERVDLGDRVWRYQLQSAEAAHVHPHFVCVKCGDLTCLEGVELVVKQRRGVPQALRRRDVAVHIKGVCDSCAPTAS